MSLSSFKEEIIFINLSLSFPGTGHQHRLRQLRDGCRPDGQSGGGVPPDLLPGGRPGVPDHHDPDGGGAADHHRRDEGPGLLQGGHRGEICGLRLPGQRGGGGPGAGSGADPAALDHLQRLGHPLHSGGDPVRLLPRYLPAGLRGRGGDGDPLRPGGLLLHPGSGAGGADAAQGTPHRQAHPAGADRHPVAAAVLQLQDHPAQPVPLSAPLLDDGGGHRRLRCPDRHRLRPAGLHFRRDGQAVRRDLPLYRPDRAGGPSDPRRAGGGDRGAGAVRAGERMAGEPLGDGLRRDGAVHGGLHGGGGAQPGGAGPLRLPAPPDGQRAGAPA